MSWPDVRTETDSRENYYASTTETNQTTHIFWKKFWWVTLKPKLYIETRICWADVVQCNELASLNLRNTSGKLDSNIKTISRTTRQERYHLQVKQNRYSAEDTKTCRHLKINCELSLIFCGDYARAPFLNFELSIKLRARWKLHVPGRAGATIKFSVRLSNLVNPTSQKVLKILIAY